jgi:hypothetical protein
MNQRTVKRAILSLQKRGLLVIVRRGGLFRGASSYRVVAEVKGEEVAMRA